MANINNLPMKTMLRPLKFISLIVLAVFVFAVEGAKAQSYTPMKCSKARLADVNVMVTTNPVQVDNTKSVRELQNFKIDTVNPYGADALTEVGGLMSGGLQMKTNVEVSWETDKRTACFWYKTVNVTMHIDPTIYIASQWKPGSCKYAAILDHEKKHVLVDRQVATEWRPQVEAYLQKQVNRIGVIGPYPAAKAAATRESMTELIAKAMDAVSKPVNEDRMRRQQAIDNRNEYDRVSAVCRNANTKINAAKADLGL